MPNGYRPAMPQVRGMDELFDTHTVLSAMSARSSSELICVSSRISGSSICVRARTTTPGVRSGIQLGRIRKFVKHRA
jgi:hypothetical protein